MSVQSEINRIRKNVTDTLQVIADTGVTVGEGSDALPAAAQALAGTKQDAIKAHKVTLTAAGWNSSTKQQTVSVADVVADETAQLILPMPAAASMTAYNDAGIQCTAQAAGKLTFTADTVPTAAVDVYVTVTPVAFS